MQQNATVLFKFTIPELKPFPAEEQQRLLTSCWEAKAVQAAWRRYWSRPQQLPLIPIFPIAIYGALANTGVVWVLLVSLPIAFIGFAFVRAYYRRHLIAALRRAVTSRLPDVALRQT